MNENIGWWVVTGDGAAANGPRSRGGWEMQTIDCSREAKDKRRRKSNGGSRQRGVTTTWQLGQTRQKEQAEQPRQRSVNRHSERCMVLGIWNQKSNERQERKLLKLLMAGKNWRPKRLRRPTHAPSVFA